MRRIAVAANQFEVGKQLWVGFATVEQCEGMSPFSRILNYSWSKIDRAAEHQNGFRFRGGLQARRIRDRCSSRTRLHETPARQHGKLRICRAFMIRTSNRTPATMQRPD